MLSYELSLTLAMAPPILISGSLQLSEIVKHQAEHGWNILYQPIAFVIFLIAMFAETNRHRSISRNASPSWSAVSYRIFVDEIRALFIGEYSAMVAMSE